VSPKKVVTLPPTALGSQAVQFAQEARRRGAELLELRSDLHSDLPVQALARELPLIVSERGRRLPRPWLEQATWVDRDITDALESEGTTLPSHHAAAPLSPEQALSLWKSVRIGPQAWVKHIEPLGGFNDAARLLKTQQLLQHEFGAERVTVLPMGPAALPFRCVLSPKNALEYVALHSGFRAAPGQRLLDDAVREARARPGRRRLGILGTHIDGSRSPRIHLQPFDRLDLPSDTDMPSLLAALHPHYLGFAVTSPFKKPVAQAVKADLDAVNTLVRTGDGWRWANTDVEGASAILQKLKRGRVVALGDGGVTSALRLAAAPLGIELPVLRRADVTPVPLQGAFVWTWPKEVPPPAALSFDQADVAVVAYGAAARQIAKEIQARGGRPKMWGARWFIAQARRQRELWESV